MAQHTPGMSGHEGTASTTEETKAPPPPKNEMMNQPLPGAEEMDEEKEEMSEAEARQVAQEKAGAIIEAAGETLEALVEAGAIAEGDPLFKALAAIMAQAQTALDLLSGEGTMALETDGTPAPMGEPQTEVPAPNSMA